MKTTPVSINTKCSALIVVDMQHDFLPGGALAVPHGDETITPVSKAMTSDRFSIVVATQDWHPAGHVSFASRHDNKNPFDTIELYGHEQTLWPDHCIQQSVGAQLHPQLPWDSAVAFIRKGVSRDVDSYSGFRNNWAPDGSRPKTGLAGYLRERGIREIYICGLARDVCVRCSCEDAVEAGFTTTLLWDASRSVNPDSDDQLRTALHNKGVRIANTAELNI